jgi:hypothetical protein
VLFPCSRRSRIWFGGVAIAVQHQIRAPSYPPVPPTSTFNVEVDRPTLQLDAGTNRSPTYHSLFNPLDTMSNSKCDVPSFNIGPGKPISFFSQSEESHGRARPVRSLTPTSFITASFNTSENGVRGLLSPNHQGFYLLRCRIDRLIPSRKDAVNHTSSVSTPLMTLYSTI